MQPAAPYHAALVRPGEQTLLHLNPEAGPGLPRTFGPPVYLRHAFRFAAADQYIFPHTVYDDNGFPYSGSEVIPWLERRGLRFPRADVLGHLPDGAPCGCLLKELDLGLRHVAAAPAPDQFPGHWLSLAFSIDPDPALALAPDRDPPPGLLRALPCLRLGVAVPAPLAACLLASVLQTGSFDLCLSLAGVPAYLAAHRAHPAGGFAAG